MIIKNKIGYVHIDVVVVLALRHFCKRRGKLIGWKKSYDKFFIKKNPKQRSTTDPEILYWTMTMCMKTKLIKIIIKQKQFNESTLTKYVFKKKFKEYFFLIVLYRNLALHVHSYLFKTIIRMHYHCLLLLLYFDVFMPIRLSSCYKPTKICYFG